MAQTIETPPDPLRWWVLGIVVAAQFIYVVDAFIVNVALPSIKLSLGATTGETEGVIVCYLIAFATLVVTGGRLGDIYGSKRVFLTGLLGFTAASLWCGLTGSGGELVVARTVQGGTAALMIPQVLATIHRLFPGEERGRAFGVYGTTLGLAAGFGFVLGGWIVAFDLFGIGWRTIFFVNVPVGLALALAARRVMPAAPRRAGARMDIAGAGTLFLALLALLGPIILGRDLGWPLWLVWAVAGGLALLWIFTQVERRVAARGGAPIIPLDLLAQRGVAFGMPAVLCFTFANIAFYLVLTLYMQLGQGFSPLQSATVVLPMSLTFAVVSRRAGPRAQRKGSVAIIEGCCVQIVGLAVIAAGVAAGVTSSPMVLAALLIVFAVGQAMAMAPLYALVLSRIPAAHAGSGAGVLSTVQQIGNGTGAAVVGALYFSARGAGSDQAALLLCLGVLAAALAVTVGLLGAAGARVEVGVRRPAPATAAGD
jgi:MFS family permease